MKIFTSKKIHELDQYTIEHEPISSIKLMERAAQELTHAIMRRWAKDVPVIVFAGPGNNGGDALAVSRMLAEEQYEVTVYLFNVTGHLSDDCRVNRERLKESRRIKKFVEVTQEFDPPELSDNTLIVDGMFGSGLNKPLSGGFAAMARYINASSCRVVSIDLPSGLMAEDNSYNIQQNIVQADVTLTLQMKKLCMYFSDCQKYLGQVEVLDIKLSREYIAEHTTPYTLLERENVKKLIRPRSPFAHKGTMGHALLIAGSYGMAGAATLALKACLRSGAGKVTAHIPNRIYDIVQISVPEAIVHMDKDECCFSEGMDAAQYDVVAIGPGLGQREATAVALISQIHRTRNKCMLLDADALNIMGDRRAWMQQLPQGVVLTPHPKEFDRLDGTPSQSDYERLTKARDMAQRLQVYILLKGHHSALCQPDGTVIFNCSGNEGMATAGSGDVLTGIIAGLMARGYTQAESVVVGMYLHGRAGDLAAEDKGVESLIASDIIDYLPMAFKEINK